MNRLKIFSFLLCIILFFSYSVKAQIDNRNKDYHFWYQASFGKGNGNATNPNAWVEIGEYNSTKGFIIPRVNTAAINPDEGQFVYDVVQEQLYYGNGTDWLAILDENSPGQELTLVGNVLGITNGNTVNLTTDNVSEATSLYFTNSRARQAISFTNGVTYSNISGIGKLGGNLTENTTISGGANTFLTTHTHSSGSTARFELSGGASKIESQAPSNGRIGQVISADTGSVFLRSNPNGTGGEDPNVLLDLNGIILDGSVLFTTANNYSTGDYDLLVRNQTTTRTELIPSNTFALTGHTHTLTYGGDLSGSGTITGTVNGTIVNNAVTFAKMQDLTTNTLLGRYSITNGDPQEITIGSGLSLNTSTGELSTTSSGTVTSVGLAAPSVFSVSGSPVTSSGTLTLAFASGQTANQVLATPNSTTGALGLRSLVSNDIPNLDAAKITTGVFPIARGGTGLSALGTAGQLIRVNGGATALEYFTPTYISGNQTITLSGDVTGSGTTAISTTIANNAVTYAKLQDVAGSRLLGRYTATSGDAQEITIGSGLSLNTSTGELSATGSGGTVTSVGLSMPSIFSVTGSPVTGSGTLSASLVSQTANTFFAAPNGSAGTPTFRTIVAADIPTLTGYIQNNGGTFVAPQNAAAWITGKFQSNSEIAVYKDGSNAISSQLHIRNAAGTRGINFQLTGDATPGLGVWVHDGVQWLERMRIFSNGNFAMNTTTAWFTAARLTVNGSNGGDGIFLTNSSAFSAASGSFYRMYNSGTPSAANQRLGGILWGSNPTGTTVRSGAYIEAYSEAAWTDGSSHPTYVSFTTVSSGTAAPTEKMRLTAAGNVGIGTQSPATKLEVNGTITAPSLYSPSGSDLVLYAQGSTDAFIYTGSTAATNMFHLSGGQMGIGMNPAASFGGAANVRIQASGNIGATDAFILTAAGITAEFGLGTGAFVRTISNHPLTLETNNLERARINATGELGIGKTAATGILLDVAGPGNFDGYLEIGAGAATITGLGNANFTQLSVSGISNLSGNVGIGQAAGTEELEVTGNILATGTITAQGGGFNSLRSLKKEISNFSEDALNILSTIKLYNFKYKNDDNNKYIGMIIDDKKEVPEELLMNNSTAINTYNTLSLLIKAIQELNDKLDNYIQNQK